MNNLPKCCQDFEIDLLHLVFPEKMNTDGQEFLTAHNISNLTIASLRIGVIDQGNYVVRIQHRCAQLEDDGNCHIYDSRPLICRQFECASRSDCACNGKGWKHV